MTAIYGIDDAANLGAAPRSGIFQRGAAEPSGWGLVVLDFDGERRVVPLADGAIVGSAQAASARLEGSDVAGQHVRVAVRAQGVMVEDLGSDMGTWVQGVRVQRAELEHGDLLRLGGCLTMFSEHGLAAHRGPSARFDDLVLGPAMRVWFEDLVARVAQGHSVCIEGLPGAGKRSLAQLAGRMRADLGETVVVRPGEAIHHGATPRTWIVLDAERLDRSLRTELTARIRAHRDTVVIATVNEPLALAVAEGRVTHGLRALFSEHVLRVPCWQERLQDLPLVIAAKAEEAHIDRARISAALVERIAIGGWSGDVARLDTVLAEIAAHQGGLAEPALAREIRRRPLRPRLALSALDPDLARARLADAIARGEGSVSAASRLLGMSRQAVYREAHRLGLELTRVSPP